MPYDLQYTLKRRPAGEKSLTGGRTNRRRKVLILHYGCQRGGNNMASLWRRPHEWVRTGTGSATRGSVGCSKHHRRTGSHSGIDAQSAQHWGGGARGCELRLQRSAAGGSVRCSVPGSCVCGGRSTCIAERARVRERGGGNSRLHAGGGDDGGATSRAEAPD